MSRKEARESVMCFLFQNTFIDKYDSSVEDRIDNYISFSTTYLFFMTYTHHWLWCIQF